MRSLLKISFSNLFYEIVRRSCVKTKEQINRMSTTITSTETYNQKHDEHIDSKQFKSNIVWYRVFFHSFYHLLALYGIYLCFTSTSWKTILFVLVLGRITISLGILAVHRYWSHRAFKAKQPLRIFLCICASSLGQDPIFNWSRDHRVHHKWVDTDADPYNINRGFFFAHIGWLMSKKHPAVIEAGKKLSVDDLLADPIVRFNKKYYTLLWTFFGFILPTIIPVYFWGENWSDALFVAGVLKYVWQLHSVFCINSVAHMFGYRPYDRRMQARESFFAEVVQPGEGSHNYHHVFPRDYRTKELAFFFNFPRLFIEFMATIGQAYDLKTSSDEMVEARKMKTGDGSK